MLTILSFCLSALNQSIFWLCKSVLYGLKFEGSKKWFEVWRLQKIRSSLLWQEQAGEKKMLQVLQ